MDIRLKLSIFILSWIVGAAIFAPGLTFYSPGFMDITQRLLPASQNHWLGTDLKGIDVWTSMLYGARVSLSVGVITAAFSTLLGSTLGFLAGSYRGWFEQVLMRLIDILMAFPGILIILTITTLIDPTYLSLVVVISVTDWIGSARLVRAEVLGLKEREHILAAQALGVSPIQLIWRHMLPPLLPLIFTQATQSLSGVILVESSLSFLGLGPRGKVPTWGQLLSEGRTVIVESPLLAIAPGFALFIVIFCVNLIGDSLRDQWDPKSL